MCRPFAVEARPDWEANRSWSVYSMLQCSCNAVASHFGVEEARFRDGATLSGFKRSVSRAEASIETMGGCLLTLILEAENYHVATAEDGQDALDQLRALEPDAILLDLMLPRVDGFEVIQALSRAHEHIPIVALSAGNRRPNVGEHDVHAFLSKPYNVDALLTVLQDVLAAPKACTPAV